MLRLGAGWIGSDAATDFRDQDDLACRPARFLLVLGARGRFPGGRMIRAEISVVLVGAALVLAGCQQRGSCQLSSDCPKGLSCSSTPDCGLQCQCKADGDCPSGQSCVGSTDCGAFCCSAPGGACSSDADCCSAGGCDGGICGCVPVEGQCSLGGCCTGLLCVPSPPDVDSTCVLPAGQ